MTPLFQLLLLSDSFAQEWEKLAHSLHAGVEILSGTDEVVAAPSACGLLIAAAGEEGAAVDVLQRLSAASTLPPVAVIGAEADHRVTVALLKAGADDFFVLPDDYRALRSWMQERMEKAAEALSASTLADDQSRRYDFSRVIGASKGLRAALDRAARVIPWGGATVLVTGETGTGKEVMARAIHFNGPRRERPFVEINCAALPANLLEAELLGYEAGAFTDARTAKPGLFEVADGGTLFLDEIGDLSLELQGKLLRVLETKRVRRLGSVRDKEVDVRIVAATHVDLANASRQGRFRQDLYYRLNVVPIHLPPLRDRGDDVLLLAEHFLANICTEYGIPAPRLGAEARRELLASTWPGNVRELKNAVERAVVLGGGVVRVEDLFVESSAPAAEPGGFGGRIPFPASMDEVQAAVAREMVSVCGGNKSEAAKTLGISRRHLYALLERDRELSL